MGGDVALVSAPGSGSTFSIRIPLPIAESAPVFPVGKRDEVQAALPFSGAGTDF